MPADRNAGRHRGPQTHELREPVPVPAEHRPRHEPSRRSADRNFDAIGRATEWPAERIEAGDWSPVQWYYGELAKAYTVLSENAGLFNNRITL